MLPDVLAILDEHISGLVRSLTSRSILYLLLGLDHGWTKADDDALRDVLVDGRRSRKIDYRLIADGRSTSYVPLVWSGPDEFLENVRLSAERYRIDRLSGQPLFEIWTETAPTIQMLEGLCDEVTAGGYSSAGMNTLGSKMGAAERWARDLAQGRDVCAVLVGDFDAWGDSRFENVKKDIPELAVGLLQRWEVPMSERGRIEFPTAALTSDQIDFFEMTTQPQGPKRDSRGRPLKDKLPGGWQVGDPTAQAEALPPETLIEEIRKVIVLDQDVLAATLVREQEERAYLLARLDGDA